MGLDGLSSPPLLSLSLHLEFFLFFFFFGVDLRFSDFSINKNHDTLVLLFSHCYGRLGHECFLSKDWIEFLLGLLAGESGQGREIERRWPLDIRLEFFWTFFSFFWWGFSRYLCLGTDWKDGLPRIPI